MDSCYPTDVARKKGVGVVAQQQQRPTTSEYVVVAPPPGQHAARSSFYLLGVASARPQQQPACGGRRHHVPVAQARQEVPSSWWLIFSSSLLFIAIPYFSNGSRGDDRSRCSGCAAHPANHSGDAAVGRIISLLPVVSAHDSLPAACTNEADQLRPMARSSLERRVPILPRLVVPQGGGARGCPGDNHAPV